jgi:hypothetical protein
MLDPELATELPKLEEGSPVFAFNARARSALRRVDRQATTGQTAIASRDAAATIGGVPDAVRTAPAA